MNGLLANLSQKPYHGAMERCDPHKVLKDKGIRATSARLSLLEEVFRRDEAFSAADLHRATAGAVDLATVYRFLNLLVDKGVARSLPGALGERLFEKACVHNPVHPHFVCRRCGAVFCLEGLSLAEQEARLGLDDEGHFVEEIFLLLRGLCGDCREERS